MSSIDKFALARAFHVLAVILWIGGVAFVTTVMIPALKKNTKLEDRMKLFEQLEGRFSFQAKMTTVVTGVSGFYMMEVMNAWNRYLYLQFWWIHLMTLVWLIFTVVLFVLEPMVLHKLFKKLAQQDGEKAFRILHCMHIVLLSLSLVAVLGAVGGSHGFSFWSTG